MRTDWRGVWISLGLAAVVAGLLVMFPTPFVGWIIISVGVGIAASGALTGTARRVPNILAGAVAAIVALALWPLVIQRFFPEPPANAPPTAQPLHGRLPGVTAVVVAKIEPINQQRRQYVFDYKSACGKSDVAMYMSASNHFTISVTDTYGETYPLDVGLGGGGLPVGDSVYMLASVGIASNYSIIELSINGSLVGSRKIPFPINIDRDMKLSMGFSSLSKDSGAMALQQLGIYPSMLSEEDATRLNKYYAANIRNMQNDPVVVFNGAGQGFSEKKQKCA